MPGHCNNFYEDIVRIQAFKEENVVFSAEIEHFAPSLFSDELWFVGTKGKLYLGKDDAEIDNVGMDLLIYDQSATASDQSADSLPGSSHNVKISYNMQNTANIVNGGAYCEQLRLLVSSHYILLITYFGGNQSIVRCRKWSFSYADAEDGTTKCSISIHNFSGIQRIGTRSGSSVSL